MRAPTTALAATVLAGLLGGILSSSAAAEGPETLRHAVGSAASPEGRGVTIAAVGDTILGNAPELPSHPSSYLDRISRRLRGDVVFGNLEGTLTDISDSPKCAGGSSDCFAFRTPPRYARYLRAAG